MVKHVGTAITFLMLPILLFLAIYFGMTFFSRIIASSPTETEQRSSLFEESLNTCGNGICEKSEREGRNCIEDC